MTEASKDTGVAATLIERFETQRLPRAKALKAKVDRGDLLNEPDLAFLDQVFEDVRHIKPLVQKHHEWQPLLVLAITLYKEITDKALANEKSAGGKKP